MQDDIFLPGDAVYYCGQKHKSELSSKDGKNYKGYIHATVQNSPNVFVVEFPEAKEPDYVMDASVLSKWRQPKVEKQEGPEVHRRRHKLEEVE